MLRLSWRLCVSLACVLPLMATAESAQSVPKLSAAQVVDKNVAARGGLNAWRAVRAMKLEGMLTAGGNQRPTLELPGTAAAEKVVSARPIDPVKLPFIMELARPRKMRFELQFNGQTAVQVFDGTSGWKVRPFLNRNVVEAYTDEEMRTANMQADLDGPLVDYVAKGTRIEMEGTEKVEDRDTYKLKMTMKSGQVLHVWIDAQTFLETKIEGQPRRLDGTYHPVEIYFRDYRDVNGLQIPFLLETKVLSVAKTATGLKDPLIPSEKIIVNRVEINPKLQEAVFTKPQLGPALATR